MVTEHSQLNRRRDTRRAAEQLLEIVPRLGRLLSAEALADPAVALTLTQLRVLGLLERGQWLPSELARKLRITPATVSEVVDLLVRRGLVERCDQPQDRRVTPLRITSDGSALLAVAQQQALAALDRLLDRFEPAALLELERGLDSLLGVLSQNAVGAEGSEHAG